MLGFCPLASSSKGNCFYLGTTSTKILIDAGISLKAMKERLEEIEVSLEEIDAVFVSHEHIDHVQGINALINKYDIPIICNAHTAYALSELCDETPRFKIFTTLEPFLFNDLQVTAFHVPHDASEPVGFRMDFDAQSIGICTDLGSVPKNLYKMLKDCNMLVMEANHKKELVEGSDRPMRYKQRVLGKTGHITNEVCGEFLVKVASSALKKVYLAHLSSECNTPEIALETVSTILSKNGIHIPLTVAEKAMVSEPWLF